MLRYKYIKGSYVAKYSFVVKNNDKLKHSSYFESEYEILGQKDEEGTEYTFHLNRIVTTFKENEQLQLMDRIIASLGNELYPLSLMVNNKGIIVGISNFEEIKERWDIKQKRLQEEYPSIYLDAYIKASAENLKAPSDFLKALYQDTFIKLFFMNIYTPTEVDEAILVTWNNFPNKYTSRPYLCTISDKDSDVVKLEGEVMQLGTAMFGESEFSYSLGDKNYINNIEGMLHSFQGEEDFTKMISIKRKALQVDYKILKEEEDGKEVYNR